MRLCCLVGLLMLPGPVLAQGRADGAYPATLFCEAGAGGGTVRASFTLEIADGRARYSVATPSGPETGSGVLNGRALVLTGKTRRHEARYSGTIDGQGGLLAGRQTSSAGVRACQVSIGNGRG